jgi:hypothetical protein
LRRPCFFARGEKQNAPQARKKRQNLDTSEISPKIGKIGGFAKKYFEVIGDLTN